MAAPTADLKTSKRIKDGKMSRRSMGFWCQFNCWYRTFWETEGRRPSVTEVKRWYDEAADSCWGDMKPTWDETRTHSKCLRSLDQVRSYFRQYRAAKKETTDGCKAYAFRPAYGATETLQQPLYHSSLSIGSYQDDEEVDTAFFRATKMRRPSADFDTLEGAQFSGYTTGDLAALNTASPGQERLLLARLPSASGLTAYAGAEVSGTQAASSLPGRHCAGASTRTISTGAALGFAQTSAMAAARVVCADDAFARHALPVASADAASLVPKNGAAVAWLQQSQDAAASSSQQLVGNSGQPPPPASTSQPLRQPQGLYYHNVLHPLTACIAPSLPSGILRPGSADAPTGSPQRADRPPRPPPMGFPPPHPTAGPSFATRPVATGSKPATHSAPANQQAGLEGLGHAGSNGGGASREAPGPFKGCAVSSAAVDPAPEGPSQQHRTKACGQAPVQLDEVTTGWGAQQQTLQQRMAPAAAAHAQSMGMSAYPHHHRHPAQHSMMHMGYDAVYGHPAYMDPYAYSYGMHDPNVAYWRMYPYCYSAAQHPSHTLYSELPPHIPDYRESCYGAMAMAAEGGPPPHYSPQRINIPPCASQRSSDTGMTAYELARSHSVPLPRQPGATAYRARAASFCGAAPPPSCGSSNLPAVPVCAVAASSQLPAVRSADIGGALTSISTGYKCTAAAHATGRSSFGMAVGQQQRLPPCYPQQDPGIAARSGPAPGVNLASVAQCDLMATNEEPSQNSASGSDLVGNLAGGTSASAQPSAAERRQPGDTTTRPLLEHAPQPLDVCDVTVFVRLPQSLVDIKSEAEVELSPFACDSVFSLDLGLGFAFDSPGVFIPGSTPQHAQLQQLAQALQQKQPAASRCVGTPAPRSHVADAFASVITPGAPSLASGLDMLQLPDMLALGSDLDIDCGLFLASPPTVTMAAAGCGCSF